MSKFNINVTKSKTFLENGKTSSTEITSYLDFVQADSLIKAMHLFNARVESIKELYVDKSSRLLGCESSDYGIIFRSDTQVVMYTINEYKSSSVIILWTFILLI